MKLYQVMFNNRFTFSKPAIPLFLVVFGVISYTLFINSENIPKQVATVYKYFTTPVEIPATIDFAGEKVPLANFDVKESLDRELLVNSYYQSQTLLYIKKSNRYFHLIDPILKKYNIPSDFKYLSLAESGFQERVISPAGAVGLWQLMKSAALENGLEINAEVDERYHIEKSTEAACRYLSRSYQKYGSWTLVAASYNAGINGIHRQTELQESNSYYDLYLNEETARYIYRILALKMILSNPEKYGFKVSEEEKYPVLKFKQIEVDKKIDNLSNYAISQGINYKMLKFFNPWLRQSYLKNPSRKIYTLKIPEPGFRTFDSAKN